MKKLLAIAVCLTLLAPARPGSLAASAGAVHLAAGYGHLIALPGDGSCLAFGDNAFGQCEVDGWENVTAADAGIRHTVALLEDGTAVACGDDTYGQCGVEGWTDLVAVAAGDWHTVGLRSDGTCVAVGVSDVSTSRMDAAYNPCDVGGWTGVRAIAAGRNLTLALREDGRVEACGQIDPEEIYREYTAEDGSRAAAGTSTWLDVAAVRVTGAGAALALFADGTCDYEGYDEGLLPSEGLCGVCHPGIDRFLAAEPHSFPWWTGIAALHSGWAATIGLRADGSVLVAGYDRVGLRACEGWGGITEIAVGGSFVAGLASDGSLNIAGFMPGEELRGLNTWSGVRQLASPALRYGYHVLGIREGGETLAWSYWEEVERWADEVTGSVLGWEGVRKLATASEFAAALLEDGTVRTSDPETADTTAWTDITDIAVGESAPPAGEDPEGTNPAPFVIGLKADGTCVAAGDNSFGQCDVGGWSGIVSVAAGNGCAFGVREDGMVLSAGDNLFGQRDVEGWTDIVSVACGIGHTIGLKLDGTLVACGDDSFGQCDVGEWENVTQVAAGAWHTAALLDDGRCIAAGNNRMLDEFSGEPTRNTGGQTDVEGWAGIAGIAAGYAFTAGIRADGTLALAGFGRADVSALEGLRLLEDVAALTPPSGPVPGPRAERIRAEISAARADYLACLELSARRDALAREIKAEHPEFDEVFSFHKGLALAQGADGMYGLVSEDGSVVLPLQYAWIERTSAEGMSAVADSGHNIGFIDETGVLRVPCRYDMANDFADGFAPVAKGQWPIPAWKGFVDRDGREYTKAELALLRPDYDFDPAEDIEGEPTGPLYLFSVPEDVGDHTPALYGYRDAAGETVLPAMYDLALEFSEGLATVWINDVRGLVNERGEVVSGLELDRGLLQYFGYQAP